MALPTQWVEIFISVHLIFKVLLTLIFLKGKLCMQPILLWIRCENSLHCVCHPCLNLELTQAMVGLSPISSSLLTPTPTAPQWPMWPPYRWHWNGSRVHGTGEMTTLICQVLNVEATQGETDSLETGKSHYPTAFTHCHSNCLFLFLVPESPYN